MKRIALAMLALVVATPAAAQETTRVASPDGRNVMILDQASDGSPRLTVQRDGRTIIAPSSVTIDLEGRPRLGPGLRLSDAVERTGQDDYSLIGRASRVSHAWRESVATFTGADGARLQLRLRAYDQGVAFRWTVPGRADAPTALKSEGVALSFPADYRCWGLNLGRFNSSHEGEFDPVQASRLRDHNAFDAPLTCDTGQGAAFALAESDLGSYPAMYLAGRGDGALGVQIKLAPRPDAPGHLAEARVGADLTSPWRVVMLADSIGGLIPSTLITDLAPDPAFDASWVKPGKSVWDWWNGGQIAAVPDSGMNTATFRAFIDFAAANDMQYVMVDEGWYEGAGGGGEVRPGADVTRHNAAVDVPALVAYGRQKGVGVLLWVNWKALDAQFDAALDQYQAWGVAGIKVDFMDRDDQLMVDWYHRLLTAAARRHLLVDLHGAFHPTGMTRAWPNFITQEGVLGAEYNKWSSRITATHNVTLPYTRMLLGPMDYTPGGFRNVAPSAFENRFLLPTVQTTRAHGLAMFVVFESPLQVVADTPDAYAGQPETAFIRGVPTAWDETRFISGDVGQSIVLARRKGRDWYVGAMTNEQARAVTLPLDFLGVGRFEATIYADGDAPDRTRIETRPVDASQTLTLHLAASGGAAVRITPRR